MILVGSMSTVNGEAYNLFQDPGVLNPGGYYYLTFPHELGHAVGMGHPHDGPTQFPGVGFDEDENGGSNNLNSTPWALLSYNDVTSTNGFSPTSKESSGFLTNLGTYDIAGLQYLYGINRDHQIGDTTYYLDDDLNGYTTVLMLMIDRCI